MVLRGKAAVLREGVNEMQETLSIILKERLILLSRGVPTEVLVQALTVCADQGIALYESTFDHRLPDPISENRDKLLALKKQLGSRIRFGAGTVLSAEEVHAAADAGAEFIVSPNSDEDVIRETKRLGLVSIPGAMTPTEIVCAWNMGADMVKLFPADDLGFHYIQNLMGPLPHVPLMATGGVNPVTIPQFIKAGIRAVGTGITIMRPDLVAKEDYEGIGILAKMHVDALRLM